MASGNAAPHPRVGNDPLEQVVAHALDEAGIFYTTDYEGGVSQHLDFYLPDFSLYLEIKGGHSPRIADQMGRVPSVIAVQGLTAVNFLVKLLKSYNC